MAKQHYFFNILITRDQFKWVHGHRLIDNAREMQAETYNNLWSKTPAVSYISFRGTNGSQFNTKEEANLFQEAFDNLLIKYSISGSHLGPLLYVIVFLNEDVEKQSLENNAINRLIEYARFILDIYSNSSYHFEKMVKDKRYQAIFDKETQEVFFAKKTLYQSMPLKDLVEYIPDENHKEDIIRYIRITLVNHELYIPPGMLMSVINDAPIKAFPGHVVSQLAIPPYLQQKVFTYILKEMVEAHRKADTSFYKHLMEGDLTTSELKKIYNQYKKKHVSFPQSLLRVAVLVSDYLYEHKLITVKRTAASFIFEYFSLLKAFTIQSHEPVPYQYEHLTSFYIRNGITKETIRMMLKDVGEN